MRLLLIFLLLISVFTATSQSSNLSGAYQGTGYFFHPTASRFLNAAKGITSVGVNKYQLNLADLGGSNFAFQFELDANNNAVNWVAAGSTPASPASGFMSTDNSGGYTFYPGTTTGFTHSIYNNRYDAATKTFYLHYGYQGGSTSESQYQRQIYEKLVRIPQPVITSMSPTSGSYGTVVTVTGREFTGATPNFSRYTLVDSFYVESDSVMKIWIGSASESLSSRLYLGADSSSSFFNYTPLVVNNTFWNYLGIAGITSGAVSNVNMSIGTDNTPYVAYVDESGYTTTVKYSSDTWSQLGGTISAGKSALSNIKVGSNNLAVVAYVDSSNGNGITVKRYDGSSWLTLGSAGFAPNKLTSSLSLSLDGSDNPYVLSSEIVGGSMVLSVYKYDGSSWLNLGVVASGVNDYATMDVDKITNTPYVVYSNASSYQASVRKRIDTSWVNVGYNNFTDGPRGVYYPVIKIDKLGNPVVLLQDDDTHERLSMYLLVGGVWSKSGSTKFTKSHSYAPSLTFDKNNRAVIGFTDASYNNNGSVMHVLSNGSWEYKGDRGFEPGINQIGAVQVDNLDYHFIAFADRSNGGKLSVMKYTATSQSSNLSGAYQGTGYFFHPTASRFLNAAKGITSVGVNKYQLNLADLGGSNFAFQFELDANNNAVNWVAAGSTPASPASGFMSTDNSGGYTFYPGTTTGFTHSIYNNRYDAATKTFYLHYGYQGGSTSESQYQRQIYEKLVRIPQPVITSMSPTSGSYGTVVTVTGREFTGATPNFSRYTLVDSFYVESDSVMKIWIGSASESLSSRLYLGADSSSSFFNYTPLVVNNTFWNYLGIAGITSGAVSNVNMSIGTDNTPYVAYVDESGYTTTVKYSSDTWSQLGGTISAGKSALSNIKVGSNNLAVVAYVDSSNGNGITVKRYDGSSWLTLGSAGFAPNKLTSSLSLSLDGSDNPYVLSSEIVGGSMVLSVYKYDGSSWLNLGVVASGVNDYATMDVDKITNTPYVVYSNASSYQASVRKRIDTSWVNVGYNNFTDGPRGVYYPVIKIDKLGNPVVLLQDDDTHERLSMYLLVGGVWSKSGSTKFTKSHSYAPSLTFDKNNRAVIGFTDASYNNNGSVMHVLSNGSWEYKGDRGFEPGINQIGAVQVDNLDYHFIAFADRSNGGKLSVMKYTATINNSYTISSCDSLVLPWGDVVHLSGNYEHVYQTSSGRDSILIAQVTINQSTNSATSYVTCGSTLPYYWNGVAYNAAGSYTATLTNEAGCDSTAVLNLTISGITPVAPTAITQTLVSNNCGQRVYRYKVTKVTGASGYAWTLPASIGGIASGAVVDSGDIATDSIIRVMYSSNAAAGSDSIKVRAYSGCGSSINKAIKLTNTAWAPLAAPVITATNLVTNVCGERAVRYSVPAAATTAGTLAYEWSFVGDVLGANAVIDSGSSDSRVIVVLYSSNAGAAANDSVKFRFNYNEGCSYGAYAKSKIGLTALTAPVAPTITTTTLVSNVCDQRRIRYSVPTTPAATTSAGAATGYDWSFVGTGLSASAVIDSGASDSRVIVVLYQSNAAAAVNDSVLCRYTTDCGFSGYGKSKISLTALTAPAAPTISATTLVSNVCDQRRIRYSVPTTPAATTSAGAATGYDWSFVGTGLSASAVIDSGASDSRVIVVLYQSNAAAAVNDSVLCRYTTDCGFSGYGKSKISLTALTAPAAPTISATTLVSNVCDQRRVRYSVPSTPAATTSAGGATGYEWSFVGTGLMTSAVIDSGDNDSRVIVVLYPSNSAAASNDSVRCRYTSDCGFSAYAKSKNTLAAFTAPLAPTAITITAVAPSVCGARIYRYAAPATLPVATTTAGAATGWLWSFTGTLGANASIDSGDVNSQVILVSFTSNAAAGSVDSVRLAYLSDCGTSTNKSSKLTNVLVSTPAAPTAITATTLVNNVCGGRKVRYSVPVTPVATATAGAATGYEWSFVGTGLMTSAVIDSGDYDSRIIVVLYPSNSAAVASDSIRCRYTSDCGFGVYKNYKNALVALTVPATPTAITITAVAPSICGAKVYRYAAPATLPVATTTAGAATGWLWSFTGTLGANATIDSGDVNSRVILVSFTTNFPAGTGDSVRLAYLSDCGNSANKSAKLTNIVTTVPATPTAITATALQTNVCGARRYRYAAPATLPVATTTAAAATGWLWSFTGTLGANATIDSGDVNSKVITVTYTSNVAAGTGDSVKLQYTSSCGNSIAKAAKLSNTALITPNPATAPTIQIVSDICGDRRYRYTAPALVGSTATAPAATGWLWSFTGTLGANAVIDSGSSTSQKIVVRFTVYNASAIGDSVRVAFTSGCGTSANKSTKLSNLAKTCTTPANLPVTKAPVVNTPTEAMSVKVFPNPSTTNFKVQVITAGKEEVSVRVLDIQGRFIKSQKVASGKTMSIGSELKPGVYFIEASQGKELKIMRVIKF